MNNLDIVVSSVRELKKKFKESKLEIAEMEAKHLSRIRQSSIGQGLIKPEEWEIILAKVDDESKEK